MSALSQILEREIDLISRFLVVLEEEQDALKKASPEPLPKIHDEKSLLVDQLNALEVDRIREVGGAPHLADRERMNAWIKAHPSDVEIAVHWQKLIDLASNAKQQSELNASLVKLHLEKTTQALAILTRHNQENTLYGSNGQAATYTGSRIVDSA